MIKLQMIEWLLSNNSYSMKDSFWNIIDMFDFVLDLLNDSLIIIQMNQIETNFF